MTVKKKESQKRESQDRRYETLVKPYLDKIIDWKAKKMPDYQIAQKLGIGHSTLTRYKKTYPELYEAMETATQVFNEHLERTATQSACGYYVTEEKEVTDKYGNVVKTETYRKFIKPEAAVLIFLLKKHMPEKYADVPYGEGKEVTINLVPTKKMKKDIKKVAQKDVQND